MGKQHYLSQLYLKGFSSNSKDEIFCYDKTRACYITKYDITDYQIDKAQKIIKSGKISSLGCNKDGFWNNDTEDEMGKIESAFGKAFHDFNQSLDINDLSHEVIMKFLLLQLIRSQFTRNDDYIEPIFQECEKKGITRKEVTNEFPKLSNKEWRSELILDFITGKHQWECREEYNELINRDIYIRRIGNNQNINLITTNFPFIHKPGCIEFPLSSNFLLKITGKEKRLIQEEDVITTNEILDINKNIIYSHTDNRYIFGKSSEDITLSL